MPATELLSSHSELDPPLPIPNRAVKRLSADDSADYPCESRTLLGSLSRQAPVSQEAGAFAFALTNSRAARRDFRGLPLLLTRAPTSRSRRRHPALLAYFQIEQYFAKIKA